MEQAARTPKQIGAILRRFRQQRDRSQSELGADINKRQATISTLENGAGGTLETLLAVMSALDLEMVIRPRTKGTTSEIADIF